MGEPWGCLLIVGSVFSPSGCPFSWGGMVLWFLSPSSTLLPWPSSPLSDRAPEKKWLGPGMGVRRWESGASNSGGKARGAVQPLILAGCCLGSGAWQLSQGRAWRRWLRQ